MRELQIDEIGRLLPCLQELAAYHNTVSANFKGAYPKQPFVATLDEFAVALQQRTSKIAVVEQKQQIAGFCKIDIHGTKGKLDMLIVLPQWRGQGYGSRLMDWAMACFREQGVQQIEVKVIDGNKAVHLYEKYGFKMNAHILWHTEQSFD